MKKKLYFFIILLLSVFGTSTGMAAENIVYPLTVTWNFRSTTDQDYFTNPFIIQKTTGSIHSDVSGYNLYVDATSGKFSTSGRTDWAQFNAGTKLRVPIGSTDDYVKITTNGSQATIGGELVQNGNEFTHHVYKAEAEQGYVEIVSLGGYLGKLQVILSGNGKKEDRQATLTYYDVDGTTALGTVTKTIGETVGNAPATPNVPEGYTNNGWVDVIANAVTQNQVVVADMGIYPYISKIEDSKFIIPAGNGRQLYNALRNASDNSKFYLANGTYDIGSACRTELKNGYILLGESMEGVKIINHPGSPGIQATSTFRITGNNVYIQKMTLRCDISYSTSSTHGVGVALEINGNKSICNKVNLECNQDTYYSNVNDSYVGYFKDGRIEGTVDFICGGGNMWFEGTQLYCNRRFVYKDSNGNIVNAFSDGGDVIAAPSTAVTTAYGYVLNNCYIDGADCQANSYNLARPWQNAPAITWLNTTFTKVPSAKAYIGMSKDNLHIRFHEFNGKDSNANAVTGHDLSNITASTEANKDAIYLTEVGDYTYDKVLGGWNPEAIIKIYDSESTSVVINDALSSAQASHGKYIQNGKLVIIKDGKKYTVSGARIK